MRILFLSPRQCIPAVTGGKLRDYYFLGALSREAEVDYVYFQDPELPPIETAQLPNLRRVVAVTKPATYTTRQKILGLLGKWPLPVLNYTNASMAKVVRELMTASRYDLIHVSSIHMIRYCESVDVPIVYDWQNVESEAMRRYANMANSIVKSRYAKITARKIHRLEQRILSESFGHVVCSDRDRDHCLSLTPGAHVAVVENGVDLTALGGERTSRSAIPSVVFVGSMDYYPNVDAVVSFARNIWPALRNQIRTLNFVIVGSNPTPEVLSLAQIPGVTVTGTVPDVRPFYENAAVAIVPLRTGGGTRLKILEAMAAGVPVISTPLGAEGLRVTPDATILIADLEDKDAWVSSIVRLLKEPAFASSIAANALSHVRAEYDWNTLGKKLTRTYKEWLHRAD